MIADSAGPTWTAVAVAILGLVGAGAATAKTVAEAVGKRRPPREVDRSGPKLMRLPGPPIRVIEDSGTWITQIVRLLVITVAGAAILTFILLTGSHLGGSASLRNVIYWLGWVVYGVAVLGIQIRLAQLFIPIGRQRPWVAEATVEVQGTQDAVFESCRDALAGMGAAFISVDRAACRCEALTERKRLFDQPFAYPIPPEFLTIQLAKTNDTFSVHVVSASVTLPWSQRKNRGNVQQIIASLAGDHRAVTARAWSKAYRVKGTVADAERP